MNGHVLKISRAFLMVNCGAFTIKIITIIITIRRIVIIIIVIIITIIIMTLFILG